jgi:diaminopimelate decarboxylase
MPLPPPVSPTALEYFAQQYGTPYQLYDEAGIRDNCRAVVAEFSSRFPGFKQFFAVKALPNPAILRVLVEAGCGLDCSSVAELHIAQALGVPGSECMYTSNYTSKKDLAIAFDQGVIINLDDISLVESLVQVRGRVPDLISFRLNPGLGRTDSETPSNVLGKLTARRGRDGDARQGFVIAGNMPPSTPLHPSHVFSNFLLRPSPYFPTYLQFRRRPRC